MWNSPSMFRLVPCLFACIAMVMAFYVSRFCTINSLKYFNHPILVKLFRKFNLHATSKDQNKKSKIHQYFWDHITSHWLISTSKCQYLESYNIKLGFRNFECYGLVQSKKTLCITVLRTFDLSHVSTRPF